MSRITKIASIVAVSLGLVSTASAQQLTAYEQGVIRIDLAGSQRMISQRILRSACYISAGIMVDDNVNTLRADITAFQQRTDDIINGSETLGLRAERSPIILSAYNNDIAQVWEPIFTYGTYIGARASAEDGELSSMLSYSETLLSDLNTTVAAYEEKYARGNRLSQEESRTVNVYARQRMLAVRVATQHCMISQGVDVEASTVRLADAYTTYVNSHNDMENGNFDNRILEPSTEAASILSCVDTVIERANPIVAQALDGTPPSSESLSVMSEISTQLLYHAQQAVDALGQTLNGETVSHTGSCSVTG